MKKRVVELALLLSLAFLAGCGQKEDAAEAVSQEESSPASEIAEDEQTAVDDGTGQTGTEQAEPEESGEETQSSPKGEIVTVGKDDAMLRAGMAADTAGIDDKSFNESAWTGLSELNKSVGARVSYIESPTTEDFGDSLEKLAADGCEICWGIGYQFSDAILEAAAKHPDIHYAIVDHTYDEVPQNVTCATFRSEEPSFLVGYIAAAVSETGKIGFIGGMQDKEIESFQYGYMAGAMQADHDYSKKTEVKIEYLGSFEDPDLGKEKAAAMYEDGCDVIFHAAGGSGTGVIEQAKESGRFAIGVDSDQSYLAPDNVLTSAIKKVNVVVSNISVQYSIGDNVGGKTINYGLAEYAMGIPSEHPNYSDEIYEAAASMQQRIVSGQIEVPSDSEEFEEFEAE
ncbi:MAG: BMP family ABC transporter substrate-binding protein [Lachnospiraceae bacterium]|nr:BMP family ABC transporter substrate-binding protein [Lachnospiraceae bacterium]